MRSCVTRRAKNRKLIDRGSVLLSQRERSFMVHVGGLLKILSVLTLEVKAANFANSGRRLA